ncbi:MAG TPA: glycosyltransferase [Candidatus Paceibacterota bacterium]|nr:glycosyltransferase [Candidatus Paceibacterota bacterium]
MSTISVQLAVLNGETYIRHCLDALASQRVDWGRVEILILDNGSTDRTREIIEYWQSEFGNQAPVAFIKSAQNHGMWGGQELLLKHSRGAYVVFLSADVMLEENFLARALEIMDADERVGGLQAKIYQYAAADLAARSDALPREIIDTCGFQIERSRRVTNIGHGQSDGERFNTYCEIFGVEGAVPVFRRGALESIHILGEIADHDLFWYAEDLDVAWRIRIAGWKQVYDPRIIAWHDRQTTKSHARGLVSSVRRLDVRRRIPIEKRRLEWRNTRWTRIKNDYIMNILKDAPYIVAREIAVFGYTLLFEPGVFQELPHFIKGIPRMLRKRRQIMKSARASSQDIHRFFV